MNTLVRVFPRRTKATPVDELTFTGEPPHPLWLIDHDEVHVSCVFTWDKPRAEYLADAWAKVGYNVKIGGPAYADPGDEFIPGRYLKPGYVITSRGCNNQCWFCYVWKREGGIRELPITDGWNVQDNNLLQCSRDHQSTVFAMLAKQDKRAALTGGLEAKQLTEWHVNWLATIRPRRLFFAYDTPDDYEPLRAAAAMITDANVCGSHDRMCYVLIGYPRDTFDAAEARLRQVLDLGLTPFAMLYRNDAGKYNLNWRRFQRSWARPAAIYARGLA